MNKINLFIILVIILISSSLCYAENSCGEGELISIEKKDGIEAHGSFFLMMGSYEAKSVPFYFFYIKNKDGSISPKRLSTDQGMNELENKIVIFEENRINATFSCEYSYHFLDPPANRFTYIFHVPFGSIKRGFFL